MDEQPLHHVAGEQETWDLYVCKNCGNSYDAPDTRCGTGWCVPGPSKPKADAEVIQVVPLSRATQAEQALKEAEDYANEAWAWLEDALDALGVETVFEIQVAKAKREQAEP